MVPDCVEIGRHPETKSGIENMQLFLLLLLGCAVQCPNKERFIYRIKQLNENTQHDIVDCIKQVRNLHYSCPKLLPYNLKCCPITGYRL